MSPSSVLGRVAAFGIGVLFASNVLAAVGTVQFTAGDVKIRDVAGKVRVAQKGGAIDEGDAILTGALSSAQLKMSDGGILAVRPETELKIDTYRFVSKEDGSESAVMSLIKGGFRTITGIIGRTNRNNYHINTGTATIGIRGTDHEPFVILPAVAGGPQPPAAPGTYDKVNVGEAFISSPLGTVNISQNQVGFAAPTVAPTLLPVVPEFFRATPPIQTAAQTTGTTGTGTTSGTTATNQTIRDIAVVDATAATTTPTTSITTTAATTTTTTSTTTTTTTTTTAPPPVSQTVSGTSTTNVTANLTTQTATTSTGTTLPITQSTFAIDAQTAADQALASATSLNTLVTNAGPTVSSTSVQSAVSTASPTVTSAQSAVSAASALSLDTATATSTANTSSSLATTAQNQTNTALSAFNANGSFADSTAVTAANTLGSANTTLQAANSTIQSSLTVVTSSSTALASAQTPASSALSSATSSLNQANSILSSLIAAGTQNQTASNQLSVAQTAASAAQAAANQALTLQNAGDLTGAAAQLQIAQQQAQIAANALGLSTNQLLPGVTAASSALSQANSALAAAASAQTAFTQGSTAASTISSTVGTVTTNAAIVTANAPTATYSNPAVASSHFTNFVSSQKPVTGGTELATMGPFQPQANTTYLLDGSKNLIEIRGNPYERIGLNYTAQPLISNADITFSGGVAKDHYQASDGTVYMGRWQGGQINVTDLATSGAVAPFSDSLGPTSAHWVVGLVPGDSSLSTTAAPINNIQSLLGTATYTLTAATHPTDSLGNVGTLNSASLTANFTAQTVDTSVGLSFSTSDSVNVSSRNLSITGSATGAPINRDGFSGSFSSANCTGTGCASGVYSGLFFGGFGASASGGTTTGAVGTGAALGYRFFTVPSPLATNQPFTELIDGAAVFSTATAPTPAANPTPVCSTCSFRSQVFYAADGSIAGTTFFAESSVPASGVSTTPAGDYLLDSSGNLVRVLTSSWDVFERGTQSQCTNGAPCLTSPGPGATANTLVTMAGGTVGTGGATFSSPTVVSSTSATETYSDSTGIRMGRYQGGSVTVHDLTPGGSTLVTSLMGPLGPRSVDWVIREQPTSIPISGRFDYTPTFATKPTDTFGSTDGTLLGAQLAADFTAMTVQPEVRVSINNQALAATASGVPIQPGSFGFNVSSAADSTNNPSFPSILQVGCSGTNCAPSPAAGGRPYGGRIVGGFSGDGTAAGAFFRYTFNTRFDPTNATDVATAASLGRPINDYISGLVAFGKGAQVTQPAPTGAATIGTAYYDMPVGGTFGSSDNFHTARYQASPTSFTITNGNLVSVSEDPAFNFPAASESISGGTAVSGGIAVDSAALAATGIIFGRYDAMNAGGTGVLAGSGTLATLTGVEVQNQTPTSFTRNILGSYQWFQGPEPLPFGLSGSLTGTATYSLVGYTPPTDQNSLTGSVSTVSTDTNLSVNFDRQAVALNVKVTMPPSIGPTPGTQSRVWVASASNILLKDFNAHFEASTFDPNNTLSVSLNGSTGTTAFGEIQGGLTGTGLNGAGIAYTFAGSDPLNGGSHEHVNGALAFAMSSYNPGPANAPSGSSINLNDVWYRIGIVAAGLLNPQATVDSERLFFVQPAADASQRTVLNANALPVAFDLSWPLATPSGCPTTTACTNLRDIAGRLSIVASDVSTAATALATTATPASLVNAGQDPGTGIRWGRYANGSVAVFDRVSGSAVALVDVTNQPMHFVLTAPQTGPTTLPVSGTASYVLVGNTDPTDNFGHVGTLGSATLSADFGAQTVSSGVNLTVNSQTWAASVTNAPILKGAFFFAEKLPGGGGTPVPLTVTSSLGTNTAGTLLGAFTGTSGQGAALSYALNVNGITGTTVSGVAAFRRP